MKVLQRVLLAALVGFAATVAEAGTLTYSDSFTGATLDVSAQSLNVAKFDTSLGTLNSVQITFDASMTAALTLEITATQVRLS